MSQCRHIHTTSEFIFAYSREHIEMHDLWNHTSQPIHSTARVFQPTPSSQKPHGKISELCWRGPGFGLMSPLRSSANRGKHAGGLLLECGILRRASESRSGLVAVGLPVWGCWQG